MALCLTSMKHVYFGLTQICVARVSWSHQCSLHFGPLLRMLSTKELDINPCCSSWIIGSVSSESWFFCCQLTFKKPSRGLQNLKLCPPTYFQQKKRIRSFTRVLVIFSSLHVVWGRSPAILNHGCPASPPGTPRLKTTQNKTKCYVQRPWWLWEKTIPVTGW